MVGLPIYWELPNPKTRLKMRSRKNKPTVKPAPWPKALERLCFPTISSTAGPSGANPTADVEFWILLEFFRFLATGLNVSMDFVFYRCLDQFGQFRILAWIANQGGKHIFH